MDDLATLTETLAKRIKRAREDANLTQAEFAERLGVSVRTLQNWEAGVGVPRAKHRRVLAKALEIA